MEIIKDYEVYGCWTSSEAVKACPKCAIKVQLVPADGHFNSKYWKLKRDDGLDLYCCPNGCNTNFKGEIVKNFKPLDEKTIRYFYMMHNVMIDKRIESRIEHMIKKHTTSSEAHKETVHYIFLKDFVYRYNGFIDFHSEYYDNKSNTEFMIDKLSGLVFFNIYSHEPFASNLYRPLYSAMKPEEILEKATKDGLCIWKSTVSETIFGLENLDKLFTAKFS